MSASSAVPSRSPLGFTDDQTGFTQPQIAALTHAARWGEDPPAAALNLLFYTAIRTNLDPFLGQIRLLRRSEPVRRHSGVTEIEDRWSVEISIHGFRILGHRTARRHGVRVAQSAPRYFDDHTRTWVKAWPYASPPTAARYTLTASHPDGHRETVTAVAHYTEFVKTTVTGTPSLGWEKMPCHMLAKCAEADAWRRLFPDELGWLRLIDTTATDEHPTDAVTHPRTTPPSATSVLGAPHTPNPDRDTVDIRLPEPATTRPAPPTSTADKPAPTSRTRARRPRTATTEADPVAEFLAAARSALDRDDTGVLDWVNQQLGRDTTALHELTADDLTRLSEALSTPPPGSDSTA